MGKSTLSNRKRLRKHGEEEEEEGSEDYDYELGGFKVGSEEQPAQQPSQQPTQPRTLKLKLKLGGQTTGSHTVTLEYNGTKPQRAKANEDKAKRESDRPRKNPERDKRKKYEEEDFVMDDDDEFDEDQYEEDLLVDDEEEPEPDDDELSIGDEDLVDDMDMAPRKLTSRQLAMQNKESGAAPELLALPVSKKKKEKILTEEDMLRKSEMAERRRKKVESENAKIKESVIDKLLNRSSKTKKKEDEQTPAQLRRQLQLPPEEVIKYVSGPKGNALIFPTEQPIPSILIQTTQSYPPPPMQCAAPNCTNPKKYNCSRTNLPLCSLQCWRAINAGC
jgi:hypothetical protein